MRAGIKTTSSEQTPEGSMKCVGSPVLGTYNPQAENSQGVSPVLLPPPHHGNRCAQGQVHSVAWLLQKITLISGAVESVRVPSTLDVHVQAAGGESTGDHRVASQCPQHTLCQGSENT